MAYKRECPYPTPVFLRWESTNFPCPDRINCYSTMLCPCSTLSCVRNQLSFLFWRGQSNYCCSKFHRRHHGRCRERYLWSELSLTLYKEARVKMELRVSLPQTLDYYAFHASRELIINPVLNFIVNERMHSNSYCTRCIQSSKFINRIDMHMRTTVDIHHEIHDCVFRNSSHLLF